VRLAPVGVVSFDFGNTLVPVDRAGLRRVVGVTAERVVASLGSFAIDDFLAVWAEERERQFREEVPRFREVDLGDRFVRVLARLRGMTPPASDEPWDQAEATRWSNAEEIDWAVETYSRAFVDGMPAPPDVGALLAHLAGRYRLAIVSNWPLAATVDRYLAAAGWDAHLAAVVISQRVGSIKPHPSIFRATESALGLVRAEGNTILHVGDDWVADVVGAKNAGWRAAFLHDRPRDSPLPASTRDASVVPDLELTRLADLEAALR
jgi:HAD superfamily hydrolase (TIGR01549 family)